MGLEDDFLKQVNLWREHCDRVAHHSAIHPYLECSAYDRLITLGKELGNSCLRIIRDQYQSKAVQEDSIGFRWGYLLHELEPSFRLEVGEKHSGAAIERRGCALGLDVSKVRDETIQWLDNYLAVSSAS
ncbi:MAG TPA: hypothetical protein VJK51_03675 [Candidatus Nanoarchaeia archaeon]|nr:hypothetical protein [Candidatus Nanoarchaeia archaeon]